jgi:predicted O-methyltransferase YrrM
MQNLSRYKATNVTIEQATSQDFAASWEGQPFDIVFIDGAHDYESVKADIDVALKFLADDGVLAFHDYRAYPGEHDGRWDEGVSRAVNELIVDGSQLLEQAGTVAVIRPQVVIERALA